MHFMKKACELKIPFVWTDRRPIILEKFLYIPKAYDFHEQWERTPWSDPRFFGNDRPVALEYCSGNGQWICEKAKLHPEINWVAVEIRYDRARKTWLRLHRDNLPNLFIICGEASVVTRHYLPRESLSKIFVNFPDPWPKLRHAKHRLIQEPFLNDAACLAKPGCEATFVTDDAIYAAQMVEELAKSAAWRPSGKILDGESYGSSFFADLWKKKGYSIHFMDYICHQ